MSFSDSARSFFLDAMASSQIPIVVEVMPLNDDEVFQYLDAHPDILDRYLRERAGLAESLLITHAPPQDHDNVTTTAEENIDVPVGGNIAPLEENPDTVDLVSDLFALSGLGDDQASVDIEDENNNIDDSQWNADHDIDDDGNLVGGEVFDEVDRWDGLDANTSHASEESLGDIDISDAGEFQDDLQTNQFNSSQGDTASNQQSSAPPQVGLPPTASTSASASTSTSTQPLPSMPQNTTSLPYPAPPNLVAASRSQPKGKKWRLFEEESCIRHMLSIRDEDVLHGEDRFREAQRRMATVDGIQKDAKYAVKNFWNRVGRARSGFDERKNQKAPLSTSQQGKAAGTSSPRSKATPRKRKNTPKATKAKRKYESESEDGGPDSSIPSDPDESCKPPPKRRNRDDDSDDDWQPDQNALNAIAV
ncbi:hypothetical protein RBB50_003991 [Rhinocladiella similis]